MQTFIHSQLVRGLCLLALCLAFVPGKAAAATLLKHIVRLKGQEQITIQGMGLVVGLNGTGDGSNYVPAIRGLAAMLQKLGNPINEGGLKELKDAKNVALVMVTATIPGSGARQGDLIDVTVSSVGAAKSLEHGYLVTTTLLSPQVGNDRIYGIASGQVQLDNIRAKTVGRIRQGCRVEEDFFNEFVKDGKITLVLNKSHADFQVAQAIAEQINSQLSFQSKGGQIAKALDQVNIEVQIPTQYQDDVVDFVAQVMSRPMLEPETGGKVIINQRIGSIVISGDVEIGAVAVTHKNLVIETPGEPSLANRVVGVETAAKPTAKLKSLVEALNALKVSAEDQIAIIKGIESDGKIHGTVIYE